MYEMDTTNVCIADLGLFQVLGCKQSGTKPNLVAKILATNFGDRLA